MLFLWINIKLTPMCDQEWYRGISRIIWGKVSMACMKFWCPCSVHIRCHQIQQQNIGVAWGWEQFLNNVSKSSLWKDKYSVPILIGLRFELRHSGCTSLMKRLTSSCYHYLSCRGILVCLTFSILTQVSEINRDTRSYIFYQVKKGLKNNW